jgi:hypothetical protein
VDFRRGLSEAQKERIIHVETVSSEAISFAYKTFSGRGVASECGKGTTLGVAPSACSVYEHKDFDGQLKELQGVVR